MPYTPPTAQRARIRFDMVDGLRGLAALAVVLDHYTLHRRVPGAWTVVDMFFVLSGFVVCHGYAHKILQGMTLGEFIGARIRRLGPLYWLGSLLGALSLWLTAQARPEVALDALTLLRVTTEAMFLIPDFVGGTWPHGTVMRSGLLFPLDPPAWTTFYQLVVNVCFFWALKHCRWLWSLPLTLGSLLALQWVEAQVGVFNPGWGQANFFWGFPRAMVEFALGVALYRVRGRIPTVSPWVAAMPVLGFLALFPFHSGLASWVNVTLMAPLAVLLGSRTALPAGAVARSKRLGDLSYPLYICHMPVWGLVLVWAPFGLTGAAQTAVALVVALLCAAALVPLDRLIRSRWAQDRRPESAIGPSPTA